MKARQLLQAIGLAAALLAPMTHAESLSFTAEGHEALARGDAAAAAKAWENAAIAGSQDAYSPLIRLYEDGPEQDLAEAFKWAWIGLSRTWEPTLTSQANADFDRIQNRALRQQRQVGRERADRWLAAHPEASQ